MRKALLISAVVLSTFGLVAGAIWGGLEGSGRLWPLAWVVWGPVGALILWKRPGNAVGITLLAIGIVDGISYLCLAIAFSAPVPLEVRVWAELVDTVFGNMPWLGIIWLLLVFPTGRLEGGLERAAGLVLAVMTVLAILSFGIGPEPLEVTGLPSPVALDWLAGWTAWFVGDGGFALVVLVIAMAIVALARRWRRSAGEERHQYRWLVLGAIVFIGSVVAALAMEKLIPEGTAVIPVVVAAGAAIPVSVGVAVTRYRLFEIDRLLSRTVTYALVVGLLATLFALVVVGLPNWIPGVEDSPLLVATATLGAAALFNPLRRRVRSAVDRRFNRSRYDAEMVMDEFAGRLREQLDAEGIADGWARVVSETMEPDAVGIWVKS